jgi:urease accessory protein
VSVASDVTTRTALDLMFADVGGRTALTRRRYRWPLLIGRVFPDSAQPPVGSVTVQNAAGTLIPGDVLTQRIAAVDGGYAVVRGQGATTVSGIPGGAVAVERTDVDVDARSRLILDASPRILTPHAHYRQRTRVCVHPGGRAMLVDALVLHPDLTGDVFGSYESSVDLRSPEGRLLALDSQLLATMPRVRRAPSAFATIYLLGMRRDAVVAAAIEALAVLAGDRRLYLGTSDLPNGVGCVVKLSASDGGILRTAIGAAMTLVQSAFWEPDTEDTAG